MFKKIIPLAVLALSLSTMAADAQRRHASPPPDLWCRDDQFSWLVVPICSAYTLEQCLGSRTSHTQRCYVNPRYQRGFNR